MRAKQLRQVRQSLGLRQEQLAKVLGTSASYISDLERRNLPVPPRLRERARAVQTYRALSGERLPKFLRWGLRLDDDLQKLLLRRLSEQDRELLEDRLGLVERRSGSKPNAMDKAAPYRIAAAFDEVILRQAKLLGPWIFLSHAALLRLLEWWQIAENGPELFERLGKELASTSIARAGQPGVTIRLNDRHWYTVRRTLIAEVRVLLKRLRTALLFRRRLPTREELLRWVAHDITQSDQPYFLLKVGLDGVLRYLGDDEIAERLARGTATAMEIVDGFIALGTGYQSGYVRKAVSASRNR